MFNIEEELKKLPNQPGVYIMHDENDTIIYVGKAVSLTKRVHQYFQASHNEGIKKAQMVKQIRRFEYIVTDSELEALVLENNLIKEYCPKYNTMLRDDKTYPYIQVTMGDDFPRVLFARHMKKDKSRYFGPYTSGGSVREVIDLVNKLFKLRTCNRKLPQDIGKDRPCLNYHIKQCDAPCQGYISSEEYREHVEEALKFLNGDYKYILKELTEKMEEVSSNLEFEKAMEYRDLIKSVNMLKDKQKITHSDGEDKDIIGLVTDRDDAVAQVFFIRNGKLIGREHFYIKVRVDETEEQVLANFIKQYYSGTPFISRY
ncbi:MAG: excinuclease ABC subunit UvrC, partial [Lachnospiraceae bacterium]|nr:excinuclease ABC subunit UvrC [Lachnospiraceae bacterium]